MELGKIKKFVTAFHDKTKYVIHIRNLKQALNHGLILKKVHRVIKFNVFLCKDKFFKLMNNVVPGKAMGNVRKHRDVKLVIT